MAVNPALQISIHALREEGDVCRLLPTATGTLISIHALREEGDTDTPEQLARYKEISIHALREEGDHYKPQILLFPLGFLSTPSARRATNRMIHARSCKIISIHALREEGDPQRAPRSPRRR